ncbi:hypothetical protein PROFUN_00994 [Planoprotostelium fungivorum]|uniref:Guanine deaminase n=1 Tax=Planoprotostelium fungivorum TaxID=1890364 RepID=A0A2P6N4F8_9EUKA|nr:hypothetical protein PROFUN_00994 [Planoprotostelium fungivorum]
MIRQLRQALCLLFLVRFLAGDFSVYNAIMKGTLVHCLSLHKDDFQLWNDAIVGVSEKGTISFVGNGCDVKTLSEVYGFSVDQVTNLGRKFLIPGLIDTHLHAPQYAFTGTGTDLPLLEWLNRYTFPIESKYADLQIAEHAYTKAVKRVLSLGTTTGCYYATIHLPATKLLVQIINQLGQRAYVGKVNMDRNSPETYVESTENSLKDTEEFIQYCLASGEEGKRLVTPIITPRFVPSCTTELMTGLGRLAAQYNVPIQSHISENCDEVKWVKDLHPECESYTDVYEKHNLLNEKSVMAHGVYLKDEELQKFADAGAGISHCPTSNFQLASGVFNVRNALDKGVKVGLGTDVAGGYSSSMWESIRQAMNASNTFRFGREFNSVGYREAFALATVGGAEVLGLGERVGNFWPGKEFDALIVDPFVEGGPFDVFEWENEEQIFEKMVMMGDDRNIESVFVGGKLVAGTSKV